MRVEDVMLIFPPYLSPSFKINSYFISIGPGICYSVLLYPVVRICAFVALSAETARKNWGFMTGVRNPKSPGVWHCAGLIPAPGKRLLRAHKTMISGHIRAGVEGKILERG
jgi:hypothetical protein